MKRRLLRVLWGLAGVLLVIFGIFFLRMADRTVFASHGAV